MEGGGAGARTLLDARPALGVLEEVLQAGTAQVVPLHVVFEQEAHVSDQHAVPIAAQPGLPRQAAQHVLQRARQVGLDPANRSVEEQRDPAYRSRVGGVGGIETHVGPVRHVDHGCFAFGSGEVPGSAESSAPLGIAQPQEQLAQPTILEVHLVHETADRAHDLAILFAA